MFITFEGGEASGKSTHSKLLATYLIEQGYAVLHTREPGGNASCEMIRSLLLNQTWEPLSEVLLFNAGRHEHSKNMILPALFDKKIVICDRYMDSTIAYQGYGLGMEMEFLKTLEEKSVAVTPDLTIVIDLDVETSKKRLQQRGFTNHMDERDRAFHEKVRFGFLEIAKKNPKRIVVFDGSQEQEALFKSIKNLVLERLSSTQAV